MEVIWEVMHWDKWNEGRLLKKKKKSPPLE